jgi:hypothetical protein
MRRTIVTVVILLTFQLSVYSAEPDGADFNLASAFSGVAILGLKFSFKHGERQGKVSHNVASCIDALPSSSLDDAVTVFLKETFSTAELKVAKEFFGSAVGRKYTKDGVLRFYPTIGEVAPEPLPQFSDAEYKKIEEFSQTPAGQRIFVQRVLEGEALRHAMEPRVRELIANCREN